MKRQLGTLSISITIIGYVVGASIFILPGQLAGAAGPGVIIAYSIAAVIAAFSSVAAAQLGCLYPKTGAGYIAMAKLVSPIASFLTIWLMLAAYVFAIALIAFGFAEYFVELFPAVSNTAAAFGVVVFFGLMNLFGVKSLVSMQTILVFLFMLALFAVSTGGMMAMEGANLTPFVPNGMHPIILAVLPAFFSYGGFMCIMEIAGEIKNPARTIPLALTISFVLVVVTYMALVLALVGSINWQELSSMNAPVTRLAEQLFGNIGGLLITIAAVGAAATSINALILVTSRDIIALANDGVFSKRLAVSEDSNRKPTLSVTLATILSLGAMLISETVLEYAVWATAATLLYQVIIGLAILAVWSKAQTAYQASEFQLGRRGLVACGSGLIIISLVFLALVFWDSNARSLGAIAYIGIGIIYYLARTRGNALQTR